MKTPPGTKRRKRPAPVATGARAAAAKATRPYTLSAAALAQRRRAAPNGNAASLTTSTGPVTEAGKAASSRNNWRHGQYSAVHRQHRASAHASVAALGKPCRTTCPVHPDNPDRSEAPCGLVLQGLTQAGGNCLDKTRFVEAFDAIMDAIAGDDDNAMKSLMASELAGNFELVNALKKSIAQDGILVRLPAFDREGKLVYDHDGNIAYRDIRAHPALPHLAKFLEVLGVSLPEALATPKSRAAKGTADDLTAGLQSLLGGIHQRAASAEARTVPPRALPQPGDA